MKDLTCKRCTVGIDDDGDGNCAICTDLTESKAAALREAVLTKTIKAMNSARRSTFNEVDAVLRVMSVSENPVLTVIAHRTRYPGVFDLLVDMEQKENAKIVIPAAHAMAARMNEYDSRKGLLPIFNGHRSPIHLTRRGNPRQTAMCDNWGEATDQEIKRMERYPGPVLEALKGGQHEVDRS